MDETRWLSTLKMVLIILVVIAVALLITHIGEIGAWITENLMRETNSNLQKILQ